MRSFLGESGRPGVALGVRITPRNSAENPIHNSKALISIKATMTHGAGGFDSRRK